MITYLDTSVLVGALLQEHPQHENCTRALNGADNPHTCAHALAETFATLTGSYKVPNDVAAELTLELKRTVTIEPLPLSDYETALKEARRRGVMGGGIYDSLHATFARRIGARRIVTRNPGHFEHVAGDLEIIIP
jgi:predicted nucleic acid-binding protein